MKTRFVQVQLMVDNSEQQKELFNFLKNYSGFVDINNIVSFEINDSKNK